MEELVYVIRNKYYGYFVGEEYVQGWGDAPSFSDDINNAMLFGSLADCSKYKCYGEPKELKIEEIKYENS